LAKLKLGFVEQEKTFIVKSGRCEVAIKAPSPPKASDQRTQEMRQFMEHDTLHFPAHNMLGLNATEDQILQKMNEMREDQL
jgi:hypothetical protein